MRLARFRLRTMMVAVAVVSIAWVGAIRVLDLLELRDMYRRFEHEFGREGMLETAIASVRRLVSDSRRPHMLRAYVPLRSGRAAYYAALRRKYERAARYPWLPVAPDPPPPQ